MTEEIRHQIVVVATILVMYLLGIACGIGLVIDQRPAPDCTDYTLNQYEAGDVPLKCIDLFLDENK